MWSRIYLIAGSLLLGSYGVAAVTGWEIDSFGRETPTQAAARHASGGHRSHGYFWFFRGGK
jgi:hypothetical protein